MSANDQWLTVQQMAARMQISERLVRERAAELGGIRVGKQYRFSGDVPASPAIYQTETKRPVRIIRKAKEA